MEDSKKIFRLDFTKDELETLEKILANTHMMGGNYNFFAHDLRNKINGILLQDLLRMYKFQKEVKICITKQC